MTIRTISLSFLAASALTAPGAIVISEIDLANDKVEIVNSGASQEDITSWWVCNLVTGSPAYTLLNSYTIVGSESTSVDLVLDPGDVLTVQLTAGILTNGNGELGLYNTNSFGSSAAIEDYVLWGAAGTRDSVAQSAGIWTDNEFIDVSGIGAGETLQLAPGQPGNAAADYLIGAETLGSAANVPEPSTGLLALAGLGLLARRKRS